MIEKQLFAGELKEVRFTWDRLDEVLDLIRGLGWKIGWLRDDVYVASKDRVGLDIKRLKNPDRLVNPCNNGTPEITRLGHKDGRRCA